MKNRKPWEFEGSVWDTQSKFYQWLRGQIRRIWKDNPIAKNLKKSKMIPIPDDMKKDFHPRTKKVGQCTICKNWFKGADLEIDHIEETEGCYNYETAHKFLDKMVFISPDEMQLICKSCHKIKSYAARYNITFEEAKITKQAIEIEKKNPIKWIKEQGHIPKKNAKLRREQILNILRGNQDE